MIVLIINVVDKAAAMRIKCIFLLRLRSSLYSFFIISQVALDSSGESDLMSSLDKSLYICSTPGSVYSKLIVIPSPYMGDILYYSSNGYTMRQGSCSFLTV